MSPYADASNIAERGRQTGAAYLTIMKNQATPEDALAYLAIQLELDLGHGGRFDYQRQGNQIWGYVAGVAQSRQFRDVANFNVGLYMQQAGFTLDETLVIAGKFASILSGNAKPKNSYGLDEQTADFIKTGYNAGMSGTFGQAAVKSK